MPKVTCPDCGKRVKNERGLKQHKNYCPGKPPEEPAEPVAPELDEEEVGKPPILTTASPSDSAPKAQPAIVPKPKEEPVEDFEFPMWVIPLILIVCGVIALVIILYKNKKDKKEREKVIQQTEMGRGIYP